MPANLPEGYTWRRATPANADAIFALFTRYNTEVLGFGDCTLDDVHADLIEPGFELATDSWLVYEPGGQLTGFGWAIGKGTGEEADVDVVSRDGAVIPWLFDRVLARATEFAQAGGHATCLVDKGTYRDDSMMLTAANTAGFRPSTVFHRMRVDHEAAPAPAAPPGVTVHTGPGDEQFRRTAHIVLNESFAGHYGWHAKSFDDWHQTLEQDSTFDWTKLVVADLDVLPAARGRGIAKHPLRTAFRNDFTASHTGTILHVDTNNTTSALGLYESVGMHPVLVIDIWRHEAQATNP